MPAGLMIVVALAAVAVDLSVAYMGQRQLTDAAAAAANDATTFGADQDAYLSGEGYRLDPARVDQAVERALAAADVRSEALAVTVDIDGLEVTVTIEGEVPLVFGPALPGGPSTFHVAARATAAAVGWPTP
jgi:hypothetical protein